MEPTNKKIINKKLEELSKSTFRSSFKLNKKMISYIDKIGINKIKAHAYDFINDRLKEKKENDGKQTPMKGHPVFIAQHACACCCRGCLEKWHKIPQNKELTTNEINYIVSLLLEWIIRQYKSNK
jgi:exodeoxyribonuclease V alpha subunit